MLKEYFANNIRMQRELRRWSQETAAEFCGLSARYWGKLDRGAAVASIDTLEKVSLGLQVEAGELLKDRS